jgi:hypothetical protein
MGFLPNNKNAFCDRADFPKGATTDIRMTCGSFYKHKGGVIELKEIPTIPAQEDEDYKEPIPHAACLPTGYKFTSPKGVEVTGTSDCSFTDSSKFCSDLTYTDSFPVVANLTCPVDALSGPDQLVTKEWIAGYNRHRKDPGGFPEVEGGCYIPDLFPSCNNVDTYIQTINASISVLSSMYVANSTYTETNADAYNCLVVYFENSNISGDVNIGQTIYIETIDVQSIDAVITSEFMIQMSIIAEALLNIMQETVTEGCKDRMPTPTLPDGLTAESITNIKESFNDEEFISNTITDIKNIHACNKLFVPFIKTNVGGDINISQDIMIKSYITTSIKTVIKKALEFKGSADLKNTITSMKKNRTSEESYYGEDFDKGSMVPLILCIVLGIGLVSFGVFFGVAKVRQKKKGAKPLAGPKKIGQPQFKFKTKSNIPPAYQKFT